MSDITVTFVQPSGEERVLEGAVPGQTLMDFARDNGVEGIHADCGGCCDCGTCHVFVDEEWRERVGSANDLEVGTMDLMVPNLDEDKSRLSCQITLTPELDGLRVTVATS